MGKICIKAGQKFGRLRAIGHSHIATKAKQTYWSFACACGNIKEINIYSVTSGLTTSCGCLHREKTRNINLRHDATGTRQWGIWKSIKSRCLDPNKSDFQYYGGRGIKISDRWLKFENFWQDMKEGYADNLYLDRIDNDDGYYKANCRWATMKKIQRNRANNHLLTFEGQTKCLAEWAELKGIEQRTLRYRVAVAKWSVKRALTTPVR